MTDIVRCIQNSVKWIDGAKNLPIIENMDVPLFQEPETTLHA